jgi:hypothetical protein
VGFEHAVHSGIVWDITARIKVRVSIAIRVRVHIRAAVAIDLVKCAVAQSEDN